MNDPTKVPPTHIHSLERCEHEVIGEEVHWLCGMYPVWTNAATAWAVHDDAEECTHLSATGVDQTWGDRKVWRCDACGWQYRTVTVDGITSMVGTMQSNDMTESDLARRWS